MSHAIELIESPEKGDLIRGTGGLRKIRMAIGGRLAKGKLKYAKQKVSG